MSLINEIKEIPAKIIGRNRSIWPRVCSQVGEMSHSSRSHCGRPKHQTEANVDSSASSPQWTHPEDPLPSAKTWHHGNETLCPPHVALAALRSAQTQPRNRIRRSRGPLGDAHRPTPTPRARPTKRTRLIQKPSHRRKTRSRRGAEARRSLRSIRSCGRNRTTVLGDGGAPGVEYENGGAEGLKDSVRRSMFRVVWEDKDMGRSRCRLAL